MILPSGIECAVVLVASQLFAAHYFKNTLEADLAKSFLANLADNLSFLLRQALVRTATVLTALIVGVKSLSFGNELVDVCVHVLLLYVVFSVLSNYFSTKVTVPSIIPKFELS